MAGFRRRKRKDGTLRAHYEGWYMDYQGKQRFFRGTTNEKETLAMAKETENRHRLMRLGHLPPPNEHDKRRPFRQVADEYLEWGRSQGGLRGRPWSAAHACNVSRYVEYWEHQLGLRDIHDLEGSLPQVEKALRKLKGNGRSNSTLKRYSDALRGLCTWCVDRDYLAHHPLSKLRPRNGKPEKTRRAMGHNEIQALLEACPPERRALYQTAFCSGLRANELRSLRARHVNLACSEIHIEPTWDKGRREWNHPIPRWLAERLTHIAKGKRAKEPLLHVPRHVARGLYVDLESAEISRETSEGYLDFHALRTAYLTLVGEAGATEKEAQILGRHSPKSLTHQVYVKARPERLHELAEAVGAIVKCDENYDPGMAQPDEEPLVTVSNVMPENELEEASEYEMSGTCSP